MRDDHTRASRAGTGGNPERESDEIRVKRTAEHLPDDRSSEEIRSDIDRTRSDLDTTVDAIERKLTPGQLAEEAWLVLRGRSEEGPGLASRMVKNHPFPSALVGLGLGWLAVETMSRSSGDEDAEERRYATSTGRQSRGRRFRPGARADYPGRYESLEPGREVHGREDEEGGVMGTVKEKAHEAKEWVSEKGERASEMKENASDRASGLKERARDMKARMSEIGEEAGEGISHLGEEASERAHQVREKADELGGRVRRRTRRARRSVGRAMEESPLSVGMGAFAAGLLGGLSIPTSRWEDETMGETRDQLVHQAKETGRETIEEVGHVAAAAAEGAVYKAEEEHLTPGAMAESVREVAREAKHSAREQAEKEGLTSGQSEGRTKGNASERGGESPGSGDRSGGAEGERGRAEASRGERAQTGGRRGKGGRGKGGTKGGRGGRTGGGPGGDTGG